MTDRRMLLILSVVVNRSVLATRVLIVASDTARLREFPTRLTGLTQLMPRTDHKYAVLPGVDLFCTQKEIWHTNMKFE